MGLFDTIMAEHECPNCSKKLPDYQTKELMRNLGTFKLGDAIKLGTGSNFEFEIHDFCSACETSIEGTAIVKDGILFEIKELEYKRNSETIRSEKIIAQLE